MLFKQVYGENFVEVNVVPEMRSLDYCLLKKKEFKSKINYYTRKGAETNTTYMIKA
jgi:hypothetical protein